MNDLKYPILIDSAAEHLPDDDLWSLVSAVLAVSCPHSAYKAAINPIIERHYAAWAALVRFDSDGDAVCVFSTDQSVTGRMIHPR